jgi:hypothetical protein
MKVVRIIYYTNNTMNTYPDDIVIESVRVMNTEDIKPPLNKSFEESLYRRGMATEAMGRNPDENQRLEYKVYIDLTNDFEFPENKNPTVIQSTLVNTYKAIKRTITLDDILNNDEIIE